MSIFLPNLNAGPLLYAIKKMQYCRLSNIRLNKLEENIDHYLFSKTIYSPSTPLRIEPFASEMNLSSQLINIKQLEKTPLPKPKQKNQFRTRLSFKTLTYNNVTITKNAISLYTSKSKVPDLQISYVEQGKKYRLSFPMGSGVMVKVTLSQSELEIDGKNVILQELADIKGKSKWTVKTIFYNGVIAKVSHNSKKQDKIQLQKYFQHYKITYFITDPETYIPPNQSLNNDLMTLKQEKDKQCQQQQQNKYDFACQGFNLPIDPTNDYAIDDILAPIFEQQAERTCYSEINGEEQSHVSKTMSPNEIPIVINTEEINNQTKSERDYDTKSQNTINIGPKTEKGCNLQNSKYLSSRGKKIKKEEIQQKIDLNNQQESVNFENYLSPPSAQVLDQTKDLRSQIQNLDKDQKHYILSDIFKIRKYQNRQYSIKDKLTPCPIHSCKVNLETPRKLRWHIYKEHPILLDYGIKVSSTGRLSYTQKALDYALYLGMIYPNQVKKVIKKMKMNN